MSAAPGPGPLTPSVVLDRTYNVPVTTPDDTKLLTIIELGIDRIIRQLKDVLAKDPVTGQISANPLAQTNTNVMAIISDLEATRSQITADTALIGKDSANPAMDRNVIEPHYTTIPDNLKTHNILPVYDNLVYKNRIMNETAQLDFNLDTNTTILPDRYINNFHNLQSTDVDFKNKIERRLGNCLTLEKLYLKKHGELMRTFGFLINVFDKYKYAIKVILFLLKKLVTKTPDVPPYVPPGTPVTINIPEPLIPRIGELVADQQKIQAVIDKMKIAVDNTERDIPLNNITADMDRTMQGPP